MLYTFTSLKSIIYLLIVFSSIVTYTQEKPVNVSDEAKKIYEAGKYQELITFCNENIKQLKTKNIQDDFKVGSLLYYKGLSFFQLSKNDQSLNTLLQAKTYLEKFEEKHSYKVVLFYYIHVLYSIKSNMGKSILYGEKCLKEIDKSANKDYDVWIMLLTRLSVSSALNGFNEKANNYLKKSESVLNSVPKSQKLPKPRISYKIKIKYRKILINFIESVFYGEYNGTPLKILEDRIQAEKKELDSLYKSGKISSSPNNSKLYIDDTYFYALSLNFYCGFHVHNYDKLNTDLDHLLKETNKSINLLGKKHYSRHLHQFQYNKFKIYKKKKEFIKAEVLLNDIISNTGKKHNRYSNFLIERALLNLEKNAIKKAKDDIRTFVNHIHTGKNKLKKDFSNYEPSIKLINSFEFVTAAKKFKKYEAHNDELKSLSIIFHQLALKQFIATYVNQPLNKRTKNVFFEIINELLRSDTFKHSDLNYVENIENRFAWQKFNQSRSLVHLPVVDSLEQVEFQLRKQLISAKKQRQFKKQDSLVNVLNKHQNNIREKYPKLTNFSQDNFKITEFQKQISTDEIVLKYLFFKDDFVVFQITRDSVKWKLHNWNEEKQKLLQQHLNTIKNPLKEPNYNDALTKVLIPKEALTYKKFVIIPDSPIYNLPFETLIHNKKYLIQKKSIRYSSHLRFVFLEEKDKNKSEPSVTIFAPNYTGSITNNNNRSANYPLEGAQKEAKFLSKLFPSKTFIGNKATKANFVDSKSSSSLLHVAMHASLDEVNPEFSSFNFPNNEKLYLEELYALNIPADLAVLSACNTGIGKVNATSGIASLQRALNFAGTKATIASLWEVPDQTTSDIMMNFYKNLKKGNSKASALQMAKINYLKTTEDNLLKHPYYWSGFVLYGDDSPVVNSINNSWLYLLLGFLTLISLYFFFFRKR